MELCAKWIKDTNLGTWGGVGVLGADDADRADHFHPHHMQTSQALFPSTICAAALHIIQLLEDVQVNGDGVAGTYTTVHYSKYTTVGTLQYAQNYTYSTLSTVHTVQRWRI